jgi:hypothetical protein
MLRIFGCRTTSIAFGFVTFRGGTMRAIITAVAKERGGIIANISTALASANVNIPDISLRN